MNKFTFIIPVYNAEAYLRDCLESLENQDYSNWEAICVDDGSSDKSPQILNEYSSKDKRIKVITQTNQGVSSARNRALVEIKPHAENWVAFLDSDDFVAPNMLSALNTIMVDCNGKIEYIKTKCDKVVDRDFPFNKTTSLNDIKSQYHYLTRSGYFKYGEVGGFIASVVLRSDFLIDSGIQFPNDMKFLEDQLFSLRLALLAENFIVMKTPYYFYYQDRQSHGTRNINAEDIIKCVNAIWHELKKVSDKDILSYFHKKYFPTKIAMIKNRKASYKALDPGININKYVFRYYINNVVSLPKRIIRHFFINR